MLWTHKNRAGRELGRKQPRAVNAHLRRHGGAAFLGLQMPLVCSAWAWRRLPKMSMRWRRLAAMSWTGNCSQSSERPLASAGGVSLARSADWAFFFFLLRIFLLSIKATVTSGISRKNFSTECKRYTPQSHSLSCCGVSTENPGKVSGQAPRNILGLQILSAGCAKCLRRCRMITRRRYH